MFSNRIPAAAIAAAGVFAPTPAIAQATDSATDVVGTDSASAPESSDRASPLSILWDGAPRLGSKDGWSIKPRARLQYDIGTIKVPASAAFPDEDGSEFRRGRLGIDGTAPGGLAFRFDADFSSEDLEIIDAYLSYQRSGLKLTVGQQTGFQSLEELSSDLFNSFIERAAFTDAFGFERRAGISAQYSRPGILVQGGIFTANVHDFPAEDWAAGGRIVTMPKLGDVQLHVAASLQYTELDSSLSRRYRVRPAIHFTDRRFIDTGRFSANSELGAGLEAGAVSGPFHAAAEAFWQRVDRPSGLPDPTFFGGYLEVGYFLTSGDSRSYKAGAFGRVEPAHPLNEGGPGAVQVNLRYDYLDLTDSGVSGGRQNGYLLSLIWTPTNNTRLLFNYGRLQYAGAIPAADGATRYGIDSFAMRAQVDF